MGSGDRWHDAQRAAQILSVLLGRLVRGQWLRYSFFAGTNSVGEVGLALEALMGRIPMNEGPAIQEYERRFAEIVGVQHAFSFATGRMGLYALLEALDIGQGDEVIIPAFTCVVVPNAILYRGARPVYVDIDPHSYNIDAAKIEAQIGPKTRAIIAQHTFGLVCDIEDIQAIARRHNLIVLEDCAHALGARLGKHAAGSFGTAAFFSTDHTKVISTGTGGMVTTHDSGLAKALESIYLQTPFLPDRKVRMGLAAFVSEIPLFHSRVCVLGKSLNLLLWRLGLHQGYFLDELQMAKPTAYPYPARLSNVQARIGLSQLASLSKNLAWRRNLARQYEIEVGAHEGLLEVDYANHAFLRYSFLVEDRKAWQGVLDNVMDPDVWFTSIAAGRDRNLEEIGYQPGSCPVAEYVAAHCVNLPTHLGVRPPERLIHQLHLACQRGSPALRAPLPLTA